MFSRQVTSPDATSPSSGLNPHPSDWVSQASDDVSRTIRWLKPGFASLATSFGKTGPFCLQPAAVVKRSWMKTADRVLRLEQERLSGAGAFSHDQIHESLSPVPESPVLSRHNGAHMPPQVHAYRPVLPPSSSSHGQTAASGASCRLVQVLLNSLETPGAEIAHSAAVITVLSSHLGGLFPLTGLPHEQRRRAASRAGTAD